MEDVCRVRYFVEGQEQSFQALSKHSTLPAPQSVHQCGSSWNPGLLGRGRGLEVSLHRHGWLNCWSLVTEESPAPLPLPDVRDRLKGATFSSHVGSSGDLPPSWSYLGAPKTHLISMVERGLIMSNKRCSNQEIPSVLGALCEEPGGKDQTHWYILHHS